MDQTQLRKVLEAVLDAARPARDIPLPKFSPALGVEEYISIVLQTIGQNTWSEDTAFLHFRLSLADGGVVALRGETVAGLLDSLKDRHGLTPDEARGQLKRLQFQPGEDVSLLAVQLQKLYPRAYPELPVADKKDRVLQEFLQLVGEGSGLLRTEFRRDPPNNLNIAVDTTTQFFRDMGVETAPPRPTSYFVPDSAGGGGTQGFGYARPVGRLGQ